MNRIQSLENPPAVRAYEMDPVSGTSLRSGEGTNGGQSEELRMKKAGIRKIVVGGLAPPITIFGKKVK